MINLVIVPDMSVTTARNFLEGQEKKQKSGVNVVVLCRLSLPVAERRRSSFGVHGWPPASDLLEGRAGRVGG